jgi:methylenetetrahydrofolate reductase (NADPH)
MNPAAAAQLGRLAAGGSIEITAREAAGVGEAAAGLPGGASVYLTWLPGADPDDLVEAAADVRAAGFEPVPHLAVRRIDGRGTLDRLLGRLTDEAGVEDVLVIAGGAEAPAGPYASSMDVLRSGLLERHGVRRAGVAGHPEGSPDIPPEAARAALREKNAFAAGSALELRIVTQFALAPEPYVAWEGAARADGNRLPVHAGLPGVTSPARLLRFGVACGVGASLDRLRKQTGGLVRLATTRAWRPDEIARGIAEAAAADPESRFAALHLFTFGSVRESVAWLADARAAGGPLAAEPLAKGAAWRP